MPLVVPGLMSKDGDKTNDWMNKLMGKKIGETSDEIVSYDQTTHRSSVDWEYKSGCLLMSIVFAIDLRQKGSTRGTSRDQEWGDEYYGS